MLKKQNQKQRTNTTAQKKKKKKNAQKKKKKKNAQKKYQLKKKIHTPFQAHKTNESD